MHHPTFVSSVITRTVRKLHIDVKHYRESARRELLHKRLCGVSDQAEIFPYLFLPISQQAHFMNIVNTALNVHLAQFNWLPVPYFSHDVLRF
jgi:hypothetical protein